MTDTPTVVVDHPAKWSAPVLDVIADIIQRETESVGETLQVLDPFAGVGCRRLADRLANDAVVVGVELQPEWCDKFTLQGDATDLPAEWSGVYDAVVTSPCYGNRMADRHDAVDACRACNGTGAEQAPHLAPSGCRTCKGTGLSWRNTYAHALRRQGGDLLPGSAAGMQWGWRYRELHAIAIMEMMRVVNEGGLVVVNMSNHIRDGVEQHVVEWWVNELLHRQCSLVEVRRVATRRQRRGANGEVRVDGEVVIVARTPTERSLL